MTRVLVVIPTYNEIDNLAEVVERVLERPAGVDVIIVDDGSPDGTGNLADRLAQDEPRLRVLHRPSKAGLGSAYRRGLGLGMSEDYDVLVEMDADLSHDPAALDDLIAATEDHDLVIGSRYVPGGSVVNWPRHRLMLSAGGNRYVQLATGLPVADATSGFRAFRRAVLDEIHLQDLRSEGYSFQLETVLATWRSGFRVGEVPITFTERRAGASKISRAIVLEALWRVLWWGLKGPRHPVRRHPRSVATDAGGRAAA